MPAVEVVTFLGSEAYLADTGKAVEKGFTYIVNSIGCTSAYYGLQTEDPKAGAFAIVWEAYERHEAVINRPDYSQLLTDLGPAIGSQGYKMLHILIDDDGDSIFGAPITEFAIWTLKEGRTEEELAPLLTNLLPKLNEAKGAHPPSTWGKCREDKKAFYIMAGWDSVQAHTDAVSPQEVQDLLDEMKKIADLHIFHADLNKFSL